eukprot:TRINITY_DN12994_c0_g1_i1.p1 TRINITY_DN12994_c0_g1~~TRINITY_DN12994_c0_g1_i1.p1  ORF type:complete len:226 (-),score=32.32 TRINITY_DN12994_c0_g1_i1:157-834(-)
MFECCCADKKDDSMITLKLDMAFNSEVVLDVDTQQMDKQQQEAEDEFRFSVTVDRAPDSFFGIDLSAAGAVCMVNEVTNTNSLIGAWNQSVEPARHVAKNDRVVSVNGQSSDKAKDLLDILKSSHGLLHLEFERPEIIEAELHPGTEQACVFTMKKGPTFLLITGVDETAFEVHNPDADPRHVFQSSSRVVEVNGIRGSGDELIEEYRKGTSRSEAVTLRVLTWR